jgi:hypothetical protein
MRIRNNKMDRRHRIVERRLATELREAVTETLFETFHAARLMPSRAIAGHISWPAPPGER